MNKPYKLILNPPNERPVVVDQFATMEEAVKAREEGIAFLGYVYSIEKREEAS